MSMMIHRRRQRVGTVGVEPTVAETVTAKETKYTKSEITRMSKDDLVDLATKNGVKDVESMTGADLKKVMIEKLGL